MSLEIEIDLTTLHSLDYIEECVMQASRIEELEADAALHQEEMHRERALRILAERRAIASEQQAEQMYHENCDLRLQLDMEGVALPCTCGGRSTETYCCRCGTKLQ